MATGLEILGAVGTALQLLELAGKAVNFFSSMSTGFKDVDGEILKIHQDLSNFRASVKFAHQNLDHEQVNDLDLTRALQRYETTIQQFGRKMKTIRRKKKLWGNVKRWMKLMKRDSEVQMLRSQLLEHTKEIMIKFQVSTLVQIKKGVKEIKQDVHQVRTDVHRVESNMRTGFDSLTLHTQRSDESLRAFIKTNFEAFRVQGIETPALSPANSPPLSPVTTSPPDSPPSESPPLEVESPPGSPLSVSSDQSSISCGGAFWRRNSGDTFAHCNASDCDAVSLRSYQSDNTEYRHTWVPIS